MNTEEKRQTLTIKENEVVCLVVKGYSRKEIADVLGITYGTLDTHFKHIFLKLKTRGMVETAVYALQNNLV